MGASYYQFCPVAKTMELLDERWTMLVVRELLSGSRHFNDLRRGLPRMSPTLLSKRLQQLVTAGILQRHPTEHEVQYVLTPAGEELRPIIMALGAWGTRWLGELGDRDLDPKLLLWDMRRNVEHSMLPPGRTVIRCSFPAAVARDWWLVLTADDADLCDQDPGHEVTVLLTADLRGLIDVWLGNRSWAEAFRDGSVALHGPRALCRALPGWFTLAPFAGDKTGGRASGETGGETGDKASGETGLRTAEPAGRSVDPERLAVHLP